MRWFRKRWAVHHGWLQTTRKDGYTIDERQTELLPGRFWTRGAARREADAASNAARILGRSDDYSVIEINKSRHV